MSDAFEALATISANPAAGLPAEAAAIVRAYQQASKADSTVRACRAEAQVFQAWCAWFGFRPLPAAPEAVAAFIVAEAEGGKAASTLGRRLAAIRYAHKLAKIADPTDDEGVRAAMKGARRKAGVAPVQKAAATAEILAALLMRTPDSLTGKRDRALLALGFAGAFRRSELVALDVEDLREDPEGLRVMVRRLTVDQEGRGFEKAIPHGRFIRPVALVREWLDAAGITTGPVFRPVSWSGRVRKTETVSGLPPRLTTQAVADIIRGTARPQGSTPQPSGRTACGPATSPPRPSVGQTSRGSWTRAATEIRARWLGTFAEPMPSRGTRGADFCEPTGYSRLFRSFSRKLHPNLAARWDQ